MKNILIVILTLFIGLQVVAQETQQSENKVYSFVQQKASPKEGFAEFYQNFARDFVAPTLASNIHELAIKLKFVVEKDGSFSDIQVLNGSIEGLGEEAIRVLKTIPAWKPAVHNGKVVRSAFTLPMKIRVNEGDEKTEEKPLNKVDEKNEIISEYLKSLDDFLVKTDLFEFKCNCIFVKDNNKEYRYESQDASVYYQISIEKKDEKEAEQIIKEVKNNMIYQSGLVNEIHLSGIEATEISLSSNDVGLFSNNHLILLYTQGYFIAISVSSYDSQIANTVTQHFIKTFKLKF